MTANTSLGYFFLLSSVSSMVPNLSFTEISQQKAPLLPTYKAMGLVLKSDRAVR